MAQGINQWLLRGATELEQIVHLGGQLQSLSGQISKEALLIQRADEDGDFQRQRRQVRAEIKAWGEYQQQLEAALDGAHPIRALLASQSLTADAERLLAESQWSPAAGAQVPGAVVADLMASERRFVAALSEITSALDRDTAHRLHLLSWIQIVLGAVILLVLLIELAQVMRAPLPAAEPQPPPPGLPASRSPTGEIEIPMHQRLTGQFLARMSHELRTPMTAILGYTDLLQAGVGDEHERAASLRTIHDQGVHLMGVIEDLLELFTVEGADERAEIMPFDLDALVRAVERQLAPRAEERGLSMSFQLDRDLPSRILSDPRRLRHLLAHLVENAIKFTSEGRITIRVWSSPVETPAQPVTLMGFTDPRRLCFEISDTGVGIEPEQLDRIFEPFTQQDESLARHYTGAGLGLAVSRHLSRLLGGDITVTSRPGEGSTFLVQVTVGASDSGAPMLGETPIPLTTTPTHAMSVLVVDDETLNRAVISAILKHRGVTVAEASQGREAVDLAQGAMSAGRPYDLILLDLEMPVMDGRAAALQLRASGYERPIMALMATGESGEGDDPALESMPTGFDGVVSKPIRREALLKAVSRATRLAER